MCAQLFRVSALNIPYTAISVRNSKRILHQPIRVFPFMYWPDGRACEPVNMYFLAIAFSLTGSSLKTYASQLSHLVRYCGTRNVNLGELNDSHVGKLVEKLINEKAKYNQNERARNNNTVRDIMGRTLEFLIWYQYNFVLPASRPLIGTQDQSPQIIIKWKNNRHNPVRRREQYIDHRYMPPPESREPKRPIAFPVIENIVRCIYGASNKESKSEPYIRRFKNKPGLLLAVLEYIRIRRNFMIWIMRRVGLRPSEMMEISVKENSGVLQNKRIVIPTKKRRRETPPLRSFPFDLKSATTFHRYLMARAKFIVTLQKEGVEFGQTDALFLTEDGRPIKKTSIEKDFERLAKAAGLKDTQACLSMFRHRFITMEVIVHLKEFMTAGAKTMQMMTRVDYESILKRVATKTGHGSVESLWHYIDLAWGEIGVWGGADQALERFHALESLFDDLITLDHEIKYGNSSPEDKLKWVRERLSEIVSNTNLALKRDTLT